MSVGKIKKRQSRLLAKLAREARYRSDEKIPLYKIDNRITATHREFVLKEDCEATAVMQNLLYDLQELRSLHLIVPDYMVFIPNDYGERIGDIPAIRLSREGLDAVAEFEKSWWVRAIEKQPMTAVQIGIAIVSALSSMVMGGVSGWVAGSVAARVERVGSEVKRDEARPPITREDIQGSGKVPLSSGS